ncbi:MAG TPA: DbpA RNA binding domain-containing protein, partial [Gemmatimonadales bacterium]
SALKPDTFEMVVVAWPEILVAHDPQALDALLAEAKDAARLFLSWDPAQLAAIFEQHAHRAPVIGDLPLGENARPLGPIAAARYSIVAPDRRAAVLREVTDALDPTPCALWRRGADAPPAGTVAVCVDLPARGEFTELARAAAPVLLLTAAQLPYARTLAMPLDPLPLPWALERGRAGAAALRTRLAERIAAGGLGAELAVLEPLFDRFDPAEVAAAALALGREPGPAPVAEPAKPWVKVWVGLGKRDRVGPKDLVGALVKEVKIDRTQLGRIDVTEAFSLLEVAPGAAERVIAGLGRVTLRGKRVTARLDRSGT